MYSIVYTKKVVGDIANLKSAKIDNKAKILLELIRNDPYKNPPSYEKLQGNLKGAYLRRIDIKHRLVYEVYEEDKVITLWSHYDF